MEGRVRLWVEASVNLSLSECVAPGHKGRLKVGVTAVNPFSRLSDGLLYFKREQAVFPIAMPPAVWAGRSPPVFPASPGGRLKGFQTAFFLQRQTG